MLIELLDTQLLRELLEEQLENDIVREDDDLPGLCFLHQAPGYTLTPLIIKRGYRIIEHNAGPIVGGAEFSKKCRDAKTTLFSLADDFRQVHAWRADKNKLVVEDAIGSAKLLQLDFDVVEGQVDQLVGALGHRQALFG